MTQWTTFWCSSLGCPKWNCFQTQGKLKGWIPAKEAFLDPPIIHRSHWQTVIKVIWKYCEFHSWPSEKEKLQKKKRESTSQQLNPFTCKRAEYMLIQCKNFNLGEKLKNILKQPYIHFCMPELTIKSLFS